MSQTNDHLLLQEFAHSENEGAFAELVRRYVDLVFSSALRQVRDPDLAEDVTQAVFIILARKARTIPNRAVMAAWLLKATRYVAKNANRSRFRREKHERRAAAMQSRSTETSVHAAYEEIAPHLDEALAGLSAKDRDVVVLRFFEGRQFRGVAEAIGTTEDAAKRRVQRALEKLRSILLRRGVATSAEALSETIPLNAVRPAPTDLATIIPAAALACLKGTATAGGSTLLAKGGMQLMYHTHLKILAGALAAAVVATATPMLLTAQTASRSGADPQPAVAPQPAQADQPSPVPSGADPQIIAVGLNAPNNQSWWTAEGSPMDAKGSPESQFWGSGSSAGNTGYDILLQWPGASTGISLKPANASYSTVGNRLYAMVFVPVGKTTVDFRVAIAAGPWLVLQSMSGAGTSSQSGSIAKDLNYQENSSGLFQDGNDTILVYSDTFNDLQHRWVALDRDGTVIQIQDTYNSSGGGLFAMYSVRFPNRKKAEIATVRCEVRPYDRWVEYQNVSLQSGAHQSVKIVRGTTDSPILNKLHLPEATTVHSTAATAPDMP